VAILPFSKWNIVLTYNETWNVAILDPLFAAHILTHPASPSPNPPIQVAKIQLMFTVHLIPPLPNKQLPTLKRYLLTGVRNPLSVMAFTELLTMI
jgi:hypothetical protein